MSDTYWCIGCREEFAATRGSHLKVGFGGVAPTGAAGEAPDRRGIDIEMTGHTASMASCSRSTWFTIVMRLISNTSPPVLSIEYSVDATLKESAEAGVTIPRSNIHGLREF